MGWLAMTGWFCAAAAAFRRCRFLRMKKMPTATKASKAIPPTMPPTMGPTLDLGEGVGVVECVGIGVPGEVTVTTVKDADNDDVDAAVVAAPRAGKSVEASEYNKIGVRESQ